MKPRSVSTLPPAEARIQLPAGRVADEREVAVAAPRRRRSSRRPGSQPRRPECRTRSAPSRLGRSSCPASRRSCSGRARSPQWHSRPQRRSSRRGLRNSDRSGLIRLAAKVGDDPPSRAETRIKLPSRRLRPTSRNHEQDRRGRSQQRPPDPDPNGATTSNPTRRHQQLLVASPRVAAVGTASIRERAYRRSLQVAQAPPARLGRVLPGRLSFGVVHRPVDVVSGSRRGPRGGRGGGGRAVRGGPRAAGPGLLGPLLFFT